VCGSDGESYDNHCLLHRAACLSGAPVSPLHPGFCRKERKSNELEDWRSHQTTSPPPSAPSACLQKDRNDLRDLIRHRFLMKDVSESVWQRVFQSVDSNIDGFLDSEEFFSAITADEMFNKANGELLLDAAMMTEEKRQLCVDALVEEGDKNSDWRLDLQEFQQLFHSTYVPSDKRCNLNGIDFHDGRTTSLECNSCICACGKWICTSQKCPQHSQHHISPKFQDVEEDYEEEDYDSSEDDYDMPEDDPDVKDIRWF